MKGFGSDKFWLGCTTPAKVSITHCVRAAVTIFVFILTTSLAMQSAAKPTCPGHPSCKDDGGGEDPPPDSSSAKIVFSARSKSSDGSIYTINGDGSGLLTLLRGTKSTFNVEPVWSPDGSKIVFGSNRAVPAGLYVMSMTSGAVDFLVATNRASKFGGFSPAWSPDGDWILFQDWNPDDPDNEDDLYAIRVGAAGSPSGPKVNLTNSDGVYDSSPTWSPDGQQVAAVVIETEAGTDMSRVVIFDFFQTDSGAPCSGTPCLSFSRTIAGPLGSAEIELPGMSRVEWSQTDPDLIATTDHPDIFIIDLVGSPPVCVGQFGPGDTRNACAGSHTITNIGSEGGDFTWSCDPTNPEIVFRGRPTDFASSRSIYSLNLDNGTTTNLLAGEKKLGNSSGSPSYRRDCD